MASKYRDGIADVHFNIRKILREYPDGLLAHELCDEYQLRFKKRFDSSGMTARTRQMRDVVCNLTS